MKKIIFFILTFTLNCQAQNPGYMGKRLVMGYGFYFSPALIGTNGAGNSMIGSLNPGNGGTSFAFNTLHEGYLEASISSKVSIGAGIQFYKSTFDNSVAARTTFTFTDTYGSSQYTTIEDQPKGLYDIRGLNYSLYFKFYRRGEVAPWGHYTKLGFVANHYRCNYNSSMKLVSDPYNNGTTYTVKDFGPQDQTFNNFDIVFGFGRNRMIGNRFTIDYGVNFQIFGLITALGDATGSDALSEILDNSTEVTNLNYFAQTSKPRVRGVNRVNAFIKLGILLF